MEKKKIRLVLDSAVDIPERLRERVRIVPLTVSFGEKEYQDGIDISKEEFYQQLETAKTLPRTGQATPAAFGAVFDQIRRSGEQALVITVSSVLSGTWQSACIAGQDDPDIRIVDSRNVSIGSGVLAELALRCLDEGMGLEETAALLEEKRDDVCLLAKLDTLEYLRRGGRISGAAALAGGLLRIKPVITFIDGATVLLGKARGSRSAHSFLIAKIKEYGLDYDMPVLLGYTGTSDAGLQDYIKDSRCIWENRIDPLERVQLCSVIGTHGGPGAVVAAFFRKN
ncbi:MAG: DegV family protein [Lachnospiraceae bacterium]|nr:DegV family protein [Lachnospiraceae bacterium]